MGLFVVNLQANKLFYSSGYHNRILGVGANWGGNF